ncbi:glycosyltransferase family 4 protein [Candidatus Chlorohelix sp.]|uniref:glycosyltransferase family 4 protein n=1 Tax=Candidatus Chlorohelix sp. TaxID=3139201 RepID=UPI0031453B79
MRILIITTNGITREFVSWPERVYARALVKAGHEVHAYVYLGTQSWNKEKREVIDGVKVKRLTHRQWFSLDLIKYLLRDPRPDVVHLFHHSNQFNYLATLICRLLGIPVVLSPFGMLHDPYLVDDRDRPLETPPKYDEIITTLPQLFKTLLHRFRPKRAIKNYLWHAPILQAKKVVALSEHEREVLIKLGVRPERTAVIPIAQDSDWLEGIKPAPKSHDELRIFFLGQLKYRKGFDLLAKAIPAIIQKYPQARFIFAGHSPIHRDDLLNIVDEAGMRGYIQLPTHLSEEEKAALFLSSDLYVLPTRYEGFGIPLLESMSAGCPVISTRIPVIDEIITEGVNGLLFDYDNAASLASTINHALENPFLRHKLSENGKTAVKKYFTPQIIQQLEKLYTEVCKKPGTGAESSGAVNSR